MLAALIKAGSQVKDVVGIEGGSGLHAVKHGPSLCQGACLVDNQRVDSAKAFNCTGISEQNTHAGCFTCRHHDRHRRSKSQRTGTSDDQHGDSVD